MTFRPTLSVNYLIYSSGLKSHIYNRRTKYGEPGEVRSPDVHTMTLKAHCSSTSSHICRFVDFIFVHNCTILLLKKKKYCTIPSLGVIFNAGERRAIVSHDLENEMFRLAPITQLDFTKWISWLRLHSEDYMVVMQAREWSDVTVIINWEKKWGIHTILVHTGPWLLCIYQTRTEMTAANSLNMSPVHKHSAVLCL